VFCPQCEEEYTWDVMVCPVCDVDTVDKLPGPEPTPDAELVPVFATGDPGLIAIARSLLDGEKIDYFVRGEGLQDLFGLGRATSYSFAMGPAEFWVRDEDAENARALLQDLIAAGEKPSQR
jgi:Putative prokaryotic signal transducing protein